MIIDMDGLTPETPSFIELGMCPADVCKARNVSGGRPADTFLAFTDDERSIHVLFTLFDISGLAHVMTSI